MITLSQREIKSISKISKLSGISEGLLRRLYISTLSSLFSYSIEEQYLMQLHNLVIESKPYQLKQTDLDILTSILVCFN
jgi:hypothetical protein